MPFGRLVLHRTGHSPPQTLPSEKYMMTSSNGNIFRVTGPLWGKCTGHRWIPFPKASDAELWCFSFICAWTNNWANNRINGDYRGHRARYDFTVMKRFIIIIILISSDGHCWILVNSSPSGQNGRYFADDIFRWIFMNEKFCILIKISLKFLPKFPIDNNPALV